MSYGNDRTGRGRWTAIMRPSIGILWTNDTDSIGFFQTSNVPVDPTPVLDLIATHDAAGKTASEAFDALAAAIGTMIKTGPELDNWREDRRSMKRRSIEA